jgi:hypothetical protein
VEVCSPASLCDMRMTLKIETVRLYLPFLPCKDCWVTLRKPEQATLGSYHGVHTVLLNAETTLVCGLSEFNHW